MQSRIPQLNMVAIWQPIPTSELHQEQHEQYRYMDKGLVHDTKQTIYHYANNYTLDDVSYSLLLITHESDPELALKVFNDINERLSEDDKKHIAAGAGTLRIAEANK